jgi:hypothetical protein
VRGRVDRLALAFCISIPPIQDPRKPQSHHLYSCHFSSVAESSIVSLPLEMFSWNTVEVAGDGLTVCYTLFRLRHEVPAALAGDVISMCCCAMEVYAFGRHLHHLWKWYTGKEDKKVKAE